MSFGKGVADPSPPARDDTRTSFRDSSAAEAASE
jgi:hypothetical protein